jgi:hypothetical protein
MTKLNAKLQKMKEDLDSILFFEFLDQFGHLICDAMKKDKNGDPEHFTLSLVVHIGDDPKRDVVASTADSERIIVGFQEIAKCAEGSR